MSMPDRARPRILILRAVVVLVTTLDHAIPTAVPQE